MCDYSLAGIPNRLAVEGEELVVHPFPTGALRLASPASELVVACESNACGMRTAGCAVTLARHPHGPAAGV